MFQLQKIKDEEKILREARRKKKKKLTYREANIRPTFDFSSETMQARWEWREIFKVSRTNLDSVPCENLLQKRRRKKTFSDKQKLREFLSSRPGLQEMLKEILQREGKWYRSESLIYKERKNTGKWISEGKIKTFSFLFLIDLTDNCSK